MVPSFEPQPGPARSTAQDAVTPTQAPTSTPLSELMRPEGASLEAAPPRPAVLRSNTTGMDESPSRLRRIFSSTMKIMMVLGLIWGLAFNLSEVRGSSMMPGIHDRDRVLVDQLTYLVSSVERGDIVVLRYPLDPSLDYIKRIIGVPGDQIDIARGRVWVNDVEVEEPYLDEHRIDRFSRMSTIVRPGHYFVLGDNRARSSDSREFGQVPFGYLRGKVRACLWPMGRIGGID